MTTQPEMSDFLIVDENLRTAMRFFGEASGSGEICDLDGMLAIFSGLNYGVFNIALLTRPASQTEMQTRLDEAARFFEQRTLRWSFWLCEDLADVAGRKHQRQILADFGMRAISHPPGMIAAELLPPVRPLPEIECRRARDAASRNAFAEVTSTCFDIPYLVAQTIYTREQAWQGNYEGFVGIVNGRVVAIAALVEAAGVIGVYSLATLPAFRRKGYGEALLRAAVAELSQRSGLRRLALQSTEAGHSLYCRMGFRDVTSFSVYLKK